MRVDEKVIEVRRCFPVEAADVAVALDGGSIVRSPLADQHRLRLALSWSAHACRRGPYVDAVNLDKLKRIGDAHGRALGHVKVALQQLLATAWRLQGGPVEKVGAAFDHNRDDPSKVNLTALLSLVGDDLRALQKSVAESPQAVEGDR